MTPLSLTAVEKLAAQVALPDFYPDIPASLVGAVPLLLVALRGTREALQGATAAIVGLAQPENTKGKPWQGDMARAALSKASTVLATCED